MKDTLWLGLKNRFLQILARNSPGARTARVCLHRWRGVTIGERVWIGTDVIIETAFPQLVTIGNGVTISIGVILTAHFHELRGIVIEDDVFIGPGAIIMPNVKIGKGSVISAGTVVSRSVPPMSLVQGNPGKVVARLGIPLTSDISLKEFLKHLKPSP